MSDNPIITQLTPKQEALIPVYRDKWFKTENKSGLLKVLYSLVFVLIPIPLSVR